MQDNEKNHEADRPPDLSGVHPLSLLQPPSFKRLSESISELINSRLWAKILAALIAGVLFGVALGPDTGWVAPKLAKLIGNWVALPGHLFLALIQMVVVPLVFASVIRGIASSEDMEKLRLLGVRIVVYFIVTTAVAIIIGMATARAIKPGKYIDRAAVRQIMERQPMPEVMVTGEVAETPALHEVPDVLIRLLPQNPLGEMVDLQMLQVVMFAAIVGVALVSMSLTTAQPLLDLMGSLQEVCMTVVRWAMELAPVAVFGLLAQLTSQVGFDILRGMGVYMLTVLLGLFILYLFYLVLVTVVGRRSPWAFARQVWELQLLAFSTSSSAAVMPVSIKTAEEKLQIRPSVANFLVPLGATINMDGTALYQGVATIFLAQVFAIDLSLSAEVLVVLTAVSASIGAPATPGVGIVILAMVLNSVGVPANGIALIIGVDRILDMSRTSINVVGDMVACVVMDRWLGHDLPVEATP